MSIETMVTVRSRRFGSPVIKAVALALADHADDQGRGIWPSVATISARTELSDRTCQRALRTLQEMNVLKCVSDGGSDGKSTTRYDFDMAIVEALPGVSDSDDRGDTLSPQGCHSVTPGVSLCHPNLHRNLNKKNISKDIQKENSKEKTNGSRLSENWCASKADIDFAKSMGLTDERISTEEATFRDHWISKTGQQATKKNWAATWRNWIRNSNRYRARGSPPSSSQAEIEKFTAETERMRRELYGPGRTG